MFYIRFIVKQSISNKAFGLKCFQQQDCDSISQQPSLPPSTSKNRGIPQQLKDKAINTHLCMGENLLVANKLSSVNQ